MLNDKILSELQQGSKVLPYFQFHPRVWKHPGCVVDLGCLWWDWSGIFLGKKRVIGVDPCEKEKPQGAELFEGIIGRADGTTTIPTLISSRTESVGHFLPDGCKWVTGKRRVAMLSWTSFLKQFHIDSIGLLKLNIEGMEFSLLKQIGDPQADQLVISFHDWKPAFSKKDTAAALEQLSQWYDYCLISDNSTWYLFLRK